MFILLSLSNLFYFLVYMKMDLWLKALFLIYISQIISGDVDVRCQDGMFGYKCRFQCNCKGDEVCDKINGACVGGCREGFWGLGCQLSNRCYYNNQVKNYMGTKSTTINGHTCQIWRSQVPHKHPYTNRDFPDAVFPQNYCRTTPDSSQPWCYTTNPDVRWENCGINNCDCPPGWFGWNCSKECHCKDAEENCDRVVGVCKSGCAPRWVDYNCQTYCPPGRFGWNCSKECHCMDAEENCDSVVGVCKSGCALGWTDYDCQTYCSNGTYGKDSSSRQGAETSTSCDPVSGACSLSNLGGTDCTQDDSTFPGHVMYIVIGTGGAVIASLLVIVGLCFIKRRRVKSNKNPTYGDTNQSGEMCEVGNAPDSPEYEDPQQIAGNYAKLDLASNVDKTDYDVIQN